MKKIVRTIAKVTAVGAVGVGITVAGAAPALGATGDASASDISSTQNVHRPSSVQGELRTGPQGVSRDATQGIIRPSVDFSPEKITGEAGKICSKGQTNLSVRIVCS